MLKPLRLLSLLACLWAALGLSAQMPVTAEMTAEIETSAPGAGVLVINVSVADGWHIYGLEMNTDDPLCPGSHHGDYRCRGRAHHGRPA